MSRPFHRVAVFAISLALLASHTAALVHELTATHAICAEHGEVIEASEGGAHAVAPERGARWTAVGSESEAEHSHCEVLADRRNRFVAERVQRSVDLAQTSDAVLFVATGVPRQEVRLYELAPKADPPA